MDMNSLAPRKYISAADVADGDRTFTVKWAGQEQLEDRNTGEKMHKPCIELTAPAVPNGPVKFLLNKTNLRALVTLFGTSDSEAWVGKSFTAYWTEVPFGTEIKEAVRIRREPPTAGEAAKAAAVAQAVAADDFSDSEMPF
jgi:hypothetical protein